MYISLPHRRAEIYSQTYISFFSIQLFTGSPTIKEIYSHSDKLSTECPAAPEQKQFPVRNTESRPLPRFNSVLESEGRWERV